MQNHALSAIPPMYLESLCAFLRQFTNAPIVKRLSPGSIEITSSTTGQAIRVSLGSPVHQIGLGDGPVDDCPF